MSPDLDDLLRQSMRRNAEDAPRVVDTERVRTRAAALARRRRVETVGALVATLVLVLGAAFGLQVLRQKAPEPVVPTGAPFTAFLRYDANAAPHGGVQVLVRENGTDVAVATAGPRAQLIGWYGTDRRTLVYAAGDDTGLRESTIMALTIGDDGKSVGAAAPLRVPGFGTVVGIGFAVPDGSLGLWRPTEPSGPQGTFILVRADLVAADAQQITRGQPYVVTSANIVVIDRGGNATVVALHSTSTHASTPLCAIPMIGAASLDGGVAAFMCSDGTVHLLDLATGTVTTTAPVPASTDPGGPLGLWYDPAGVVHVSVAPLMQAHYVDVVDWRLSGASWLRDGTGVVTRTYPTGSSSLRLERLPKDAPFDEGRWIVESSPEVDLGYARGPVAVQPQPVTPTPTPTSTLPPAPATPAWTASLVAEPNTAPPTTSIEVHAGGTVERLAQVDSSVVSLAGWTGPGRRTLVWGASQDYPGDQAIYSATLASDGSVASPAAPLTAPDGTALTGHAFVLNDGRLVVWERTAVTDGQQVTGRLLRFSADLATATSQQLPPGDIIFATSRFVGLQDLTKGSGHVSIVGTSGASATVDFPSCATVFRVSVAPDEHNVALSCRGEEVDLVPLLGDGVTQVGNGYQPLDPTPGPVLTTWWDTDGRLWASSEGSDGSVRNVRSNWTPAHDDFSWEIGVEQDVVFREYVGSYAVALHATDGAGAVSTSGQWRTETVPSTDLGSGSYTDQWGPSLVVRPSG